MLPSSCTTVHLRAALSGDPPTPYTLTVLRYSGPAVSLPGTVISGLTCTLNTGAARSCNVSTTPVTGFNAGDALNLRLVGTSTFSTAGVSFFGVLSCD